MAQLALFGGPPAVTLSKPDWPIISEDEIASVVKQMRSGQFSAYSKEGVIAEVEEAFATYQGTEYALSFNSGTASIHSACFAAGVGPGDEVLTTSNTWISAITAIMHGGGVPVFCDISPNNHAIDPEEIRKKAGPKTKAVIVCHLWGIPADMDAVLEISKEKKLVVIEDCSHSHGATYKGEKVGNIGDIGCFSLQETKSIVAGEGGLLVTDNRLYYEKAMLLGHHGIRLEQELELEETKRYASAGLYWKYRMPHLEAAITKGQLKHLDRWNKMRGKNREYLRKNIKDINLVVYPNIPDHVELGFYGTPTIYNEDKANGVSRNTFLEAMAAEGVDISNGYQVWYLEPLFQEKSLFGKRYPWQVPERGHHPKKGDLPKTEEMANKIMVLPVFAEPCEELLDQYAEAFHKVTSNLKDLKEYQESHRKKTEYEN